jgi:uncharacterized protein YbbC (DUF1343 family)
VKSTIKTGLDRISSSSFKKFSGARIGLVIHPASINSRLEHAIDIFLRRKIFVVRALFGPQHGIKGETQDNMIEWESYRHDKTGLPVFSLYGKNRKPDPDMLEDIDIIIIDLQDIGSRYYTYIWTMALVMDACATLHKTVVVLDRPNPLGGKGIEGPLLSPAFASFVGLHPLPVRHGMTIGEVARYLRDFFFQNLKLEIIKMKGWARDSWFDETCLPWVPPSPNMPTLDTATVYPGMCLLEATNISEGRGTTRPFEVFGAPFIDPDILVKRLGQYRLPGVSFRPHYFSPTFHKHAEKLCGGAQIHVTDRNRYKPFKSAVAILQSIYELYPGRFSWKKPPYEYEKNLLPIDILAGTDRLRKEITDGAHLNNMESWWNTSLREFDKNIRRKYLLYP